MPSSHKKHQPTGTQTVRTLLKPIWKQDEGVLTFEWILVLTLLVIGIVGGLSAVRDGLIDELGDVAEAVINVDQSFTVTPPDCSPECTWGLSGSYSDPGPNTIDRLRPNEPPVSQQKGKP